MTLNALETMPCNIEAEAKLLGCILLNIESLHAVLAAFPNADELFYDLRHANLFAAIRETHDIDPIRLQELLRSRNQLEQLGGLSYICGLSSLAATGGDYEAMPYAQSLANDLTRRKLIEAGYRIHQAGRESDSAAEALSDAERMILQIGEGFQSDSDPSIKSLVLNAIAELEDAHQNQGKIRGLSTGFNRLDKATCGLKAGQMIVVAARPGVGKTSLAMNIAEFVAVDSGNAVGIFSLEMTGAELVHRMACSRSGVDTRRAAFGELTEGDFPRITAHAGQISKSPIYVCEKSGLTIAQLSARARRMHRRYGLKLLIIDYLQLIQSRVKGNRNEQITEISNGIKTLAKDLRIPVIILSQLSRDIEKADREPRLSDLRDSGAIEQDADMVLLLDPQKGEDGAIPDRQLVRAHMPKHRGGPTGIFDLMFVRPFTRFENVSPVSEDYARN